MLTVLCPTYNHEKYLADCLEGFVRQETEFEFEVLVIDDASTDKSASIIRDYARRYPRIIKPILRETNLGVLKSISWAYPVATDYVACCEGDDRWVSTSFVQKALSFLQEHPECVMYVGNTIYHDHVAGTQQALHCNKASGWISLNDIKYYHTSARICRFFRHTPIFDMPELHYYLTLGPSYYHDEIVSVYNITGTGMYSSLSPQQQLKWALQIYYALNKLFNYKYDDVYTIYCIKRKYRNFWKIIKMMLGPRLFWPLYYRLRGYPTDFKIQWRDDNEYL